MEAAILRRLILASVILILSTGAIIPGLTTSVKRYNNEGVAVCSSPVCKKAADDLLQSMDSSVDPCQDFYSFACGQWIRTHPVPQHTSKWNHFDVTSEKIDRTLKGLLEEPDLPDDPPPVVAARQMYRACMDIHSREQEGLTLLVRMSTELGGWPMATQEWTGKNFNGTAIVVKMTKDLDVDPLIVLLISYDRKNTSRRVIILDQPTLKMGLPRAMTVEPKKYPEQVAAYEQWIIDTANELAHAQGYTLPVQQVADDARSLLEFETNLMKLTSDPELRRKQDRMYSPMTLRDLQRRTDPACGKADLSCIQWVSYIQSVLVETRIVIGPKESIIVNEVDYLVKMMELLNNTPQRVLANYLQWHFVKSFAIDTTTKMRNLNLKFVKVLSGIKTLTERSMICIDRTNTHLKMATSYMYVKKVFSKESRSAATSMVKNIRAAFVDRMKQADWMDAKTKRSALDKAHYMGEFIGYPDWFHNSTALASYYDWIRVGKSHFQNMAFFKYGASLKAMKRLRKPVDRFEWTTAPDVVNAFYGSAINSMILPAGILQPPFFQLGNFKSLNYGGIGSIVGHEITHGFDDLGSQSDKLGNVVHWWSKPTYETFVNKTQCIIDQYGNYTIRELDKGLNTTAMLNGKHTRAENVADNGGLKAAFLAYRRASKSHGPEHRLPGLEQYSHDQLFFIGYASIWCENDNKEALLRYLTVDVHSPHNFRVLGSVSNSQDFASAFQCPLGSPMNPRAKCSVW